MRRMCVRKGAAARFFFVLLGSSPAAAVAADCNRNGVEDSIDLSGSEVRFDPSRTFQLEGRWLSIAAGDVDGDGRPDLFGHEADPKPALVLLLQDCAGAPTVERRVYLARPAKSVAPIDLDGD